MPSPAAPTGSAVTAPAPPAPRFPATPPAALRVTVVQDGARLHYAAPLGLHRAGALRWMYTDWFVRRGTIGRLARWVARRAPLGPLGGPVERAMERQCDGLPPNRVRTNPLLALAARRFAARAPSAEAAWAATSRMTGDWIGRRGFGGANALFGFVRNLDPRLCAAARAAGLLTVADQMIAPAAVEAAEADRQRDRWPGWDPAAHRSDLALVADLERRTWAHLDRVTCGSDYVRRGLESQGVPPERILTVPYPIDAARYHVIARRGRPGPVVVGFVGTVGLRKGAGYFGAVARRLLRPSIRFVMVGPVHLSDAAARSFAGAAELVGGVPRSAIAGWLDRFDLFLFPSTCEGSAGAAMEAMACGLPVVTSPNSGSIVRHGVDGFVVPHDDVDGLTACIDRLAGDASLRLAMGAEARRAAEAATVDRYGRQLAEAMVAARPQA
jgi:glycosyltransferase involved in cell wall biosynthesis